MEASRCIGVPNKGLTHAGVFHADDVFATALLRILNPSIEITRSNIVPEGFEGIVYDIGGGPFDHHQGVAHMRANGVAYSSFGLLWKEYWAAILHEDDAMDFDESFVQPIDLADNTGALNPISQCVSDFKPQGPATAEELDSSFWEAVAWSQGVLDRKFESYRSRRAAQEYVLQAMKLCDGEVLVLNRFAPWQPSVVDSDYVYVVYPSVRGGYNVQCVPERLGDGSMSLPLPKAWRGLTADELRAETGVGDAVFCHRAGFLCAAESLGGALTLAHIALSEKERLRRDGQQ